MQRAYAVCLATYPEQRAYTKQGIAAVEGQKTAAAELRTWFARSLATCRAPCNKDQPV